MVNKCCFKEEYRPLIEATKTGKLQQNKLQIKAKCVHGSPILLKHIKSALKRRLPELMPAPVRHDGHMVLVGAGPSVSKYIDSIKEQRKAGRPIICIKGSHDWMVENDIPIDMCIAVDPQESQVRYFQKAQKNTVYALASQCHPKLFTHLKDCKILLWHAYSKVGEEKYLKGRMCVLGGTTSGLRAMCIAYLLGFSRLEMYGFDSCSNTGVSGHTSHEKMLHVRVNDEDHFATPAMVKQAEEFQEMFKMLPDLSVRIYGDGLIKSVMEEKRKKHEAKILTPVEVK